MPPEVIVFCKIFASNYTSSCADTGGLGCLVPTPEYKTLSQCLQFTTMGPLGYALCYAQVCCTIRYDLVAFRDSLNMSWHGTVGPSLIAASLLWDGAESLPNHFHSCTFNFTGGQTAYTVAVSSLERNHNFALAFIDHNWFRQPCVRRITCALGLLLGNTRTFTSQRDVLADTLNISCWA